MFKYTSSHQWEVTDDFWELRDVFLEHVACWAHSDCSVGQKANACAFANEFHSWKAERLQSIPGGGHLSRTLTFSAAGYIPCLRFTGKSVSVRFSLSCPWFFNNNNNNFLVKVFLSAIQFFHQFLSLPPFADVFPLHLLLLVLVA